MFFVGFILDTQREKRGGCPCLRSFQFLLVRWGRRMERERGKYREKEIEEDKESGHSKDRERGGKEREKDKRGRRVRGRGRGSICKILLLLNFHF